MNPVIQQLLTQIGLYLLVFITGILFVNQRSRGLLFKYIMVRSNKNKKLIIFIIGVTGRYIKTGTMKESQLKWKSATGNKCSVPLDNDFVFDFNGVSAITYDEVHNRFIKIVGDMEVDKGIDPIKVDIMIQRAYLLGLIQQANMILFILILMIVCTLAVFFCIYKISSVGNQVAGLRELIYNMSMNASMVI